MYKTATLVLLLGMCIQLAACSYTSPKRVELHTDLLGNKVNMMVCFDSVSLEGNLFIVADNIQHKVTVIDTDSGTMMIVNTDECVVRGKSE